MSAQINSETVVAALRAGFSNTQIASSLGVTDSAVLQYIEAHNLQDLAAQNSKFQKIDTTLNSLEEMVLGKLEKSINMAVMDPLKWTAIYKTLNGAKRRSLAEGQNLTNINNVKLVTLNMPAQVQVKVGLSSRNEVVEIGGRAITTMPSGKVVAMAGVTTRGSLSHDKQTISDLI